ncbi:hypothetical protein KCU67_g446, partial [Aureobasidium melanogenum]
MSPSPLSFEGTAGKSGASLRDLSLSATFFWDQTQKKHISSPISDKVAVGKQRDLPENELVVMALNEIAVQRGRGFFLHFRNRDTLKKTSGGAKSKTDDGQSCPPSRTASSAIEPDFPAIAFMDFVWDEISQAGFYESSHRSRYLKSDGQLNLPHDMTPMYGLQYTAHARYPLYLTSSESLVIMSSSDTLYLASTEELVGVIGRWDKPSAPTCLRPDMRLNTAPYVWSGVDTTKKHAKKASGHDKPPTQSNQREQEKKDAEKDRKKKANQDKLDILTARYRVQNVEALYDKILERCTPSALRPNLCARSIKDLIPRSFHSEAGTPLGTPITRLEQSAHDGKNDSSNPPSRRGGHLNRSSKRQKQRQFEQETSSEQDDGNNIEIE